MYDGGSQFDTRNLFRVGDDGFETGDKGSGGVEGRELARFRRSGDVDEGGGMSSTVSDSSSAKGTSYSPSISSE